jgi:hypothetical protein
MSSAEVIAGRLRYRNFYVPSVADQFIYYLLKKVLKQSINSTQLNRLQHLYADHPSECQRRVTRFWPKNTALAIQHALVEQDLTWLENRLPNLLVELNRSAPVERRFDRHAAKLRDLGRRLRRALYPTGMSVLVTGDESSLRSNIVDGLLQTLSPAFRWTARAKLPNGFMSSVSFAAKVFCARRRSTLSVTTDDSEQSTLGLRRIRSRSIRLLFRPDLVLALETPTLDTAPTRQATNHSPMCLRTCTIHLDANSNPDEIVSAGTRAVIDWLTSRLERRQPAASLSTAQSNNSLERIAAPVELRSAGLD